MIITKEVLEIQESLERRISTILKFLGIKEKLQQENIIHSQNTNLAYIKPHKLEINNTTYLFFNGRNEVFINTLETSISITKLEQHIKLYKGKIIFFFVSL